MGDVDLVIVCAGLAAAKVLRAAGVSFARRRCASRWAGGSWLLARPWQGTG